MLSSWTNFNQAFGNNIINKDRGKTGEKEKASGNTKDTKLRFGLIKQILDC